MSSSETICALATATGSASVAIIRLSGPQALTLAQSITGKTLTPRHAHFASFYTHSQQLIDQGIAIYFPAPASFTGEDVVELQPHGNAYVCQQIMQTLTHYGARLAIAGEFSERAFINGKLDLTQLEAIADLIASGSQQAARSAVQSMQGKFSQQVHAVLKELIQIRTHIEASLDFAEEDIETQTRDTVAGQLTQLIQRVQALFQLAEKGSQLQKGFTLVLTGRPNVGKSSLFNALCAEERAIVTDIPGTTRDVVSTDLHINGVPVRLLDTAGIRESAEQVEQQGIMRARSAIDNADIILEVYQAGQRNNDHTTQKENAIRVMNKCDLLSPPPAQTEQEVMVSAKTGAGIETLRERIAQRLQIQPADQQAPFSARHRHLDALKRSLEHGDQALHLIQSDLPLELAAEELRLAQQTLGEITGEFTPDDLLDYVFREFCIGK